MSNNEQTTAMAATLPDASEARELLQNLCDNGFEGNISATALALGRDDEYISDALEGNEEIDDALIIKMRGIAQERGVDV